MKKSILTFAAAAAITSGFGVQASAQDVKVKDGDTLWELSKKYEVSVEELKSWNNLASHTIHPDDVLKISRDEYHTIKSGDTLWKIANKYGVTVDNLKTWNKLNSDIIYPGRQLFILTGQNNTSAPAEAEKVSAPVQKAAAPQTAKAPAAPKSEAAKPAQQSEPAKPAPKAEPVSSNNASADTQGEASKELTARATGYTAYCEGCSGVTATGVDLKANPDAKVIAVDPNVIPLGSKVYVEGYGYATAADTGGAIKGNKIDLYFQNKSDAINWGAKQVSVKVLK
ncbi:LysM peptidoglycan-binding domain-containing protein [Peribacillus cavernae]|uniref:LysM peptidoglycan-binding domain-containing protein n=1 Tax=Peribacillus cavernae TaxID=1674310 RepID=A0A3S0VLM8_9BACI|nr:3D domain-containing protein [Peribacillus cavernae]RUQ28299.1 LysM peptidoglycan-binding domain-containing protein [Peribacillus cavernae]